MKREKNQECLDHLGLYSELPIGEMARGREWLIERLQSERVDAASVAAARSNPTFPRSWRLAMISAAAAAIVLTVVSVMLVQNRATGVIAEGSFSRVIAGKEEPLQQGQSIDFGETVRSTGEGGVFALPDGTRIEMRSKSELALERAPDGVRIRLNSGDILVSAAKQRTGHLYVQTKDVTVSVVGTVFVVNAEEEGSRVSVIEGEVRVHQGNIETKLRPGEHVSTAAKPELRALKEEIAWSTKAEEHLALLQQSTTSPLSADGQTTEAPKLRFEEVAIRPCTPEQLRAPDPPPGARGGGNARFIEITPGRFYARCMTVAWLISISHRKLLQPESLGGGAQGLDLAMGKTYYYGAESEVTSEDSKRIREKLHILGGPEWIIPDGYTIEAITDGSTDALTMQRVMLWDLLERRFQVRVHTETEQVPAFALTIAPGGLKIRPFQDGDCEKEKKSNFPNPKPRCGFGVQGGLNGPNKRWEISNAPLSSLALALDLGAPVIDRTGNTDRFAMIFEYAPEEGSPKLLRQCQEYMEKNPDRPSCLGRTTAPPIRTALSELGLKVEPAKAPREFIVVDRVERPSPN